MFGHKPLRVLCPDCVVRSSRLRLPDRRSLWDSTPRGTPASPDCPDAPSSHTHTRLALQRRTCAPWCHSFPKRVCRAFVMTRSAAEAVLMGAEASRLRGGQERLLSQVPDDHRLGPCSPTGTSRLILCVAFILCPPTRGSRNPTIRAPPEFSVLFVHQMPLPRKRQALRKKKQQAENGVTALSPTLANQGLVPT